MRLHHIAFGVAAILVAFAISAPMAWTEHAALIVLALPVLAVGLVLATGSKIWDLIHPRSDGRYSRRELDRAFEAGRSVGSLDGPSKKTWDRWRREGFEH